MKINIFTLLLTIVHIYSEHINRILVLVFPGGKSHHFILRELLSYTKTKSTNYEFHIICHNYDKILWKGTDHNIYNYGNVEHYTQVFEKALKTVREDPIFGYVDFHHAMLDNYQAFLDAKILSKLRPIKFDMILTDYPNYMSVVLKQELKIPKSMFFTPTCTPSILYDDLEMNTAYVPLIGSEFTEKMNFFQRLQNFVFHYGSRVFFKWYMYQQQQFWRKNNINVTSDIFIHDSVYLSQCTNGVHFPVPMPPNFGNIGAVLPRPAKRIEGKLEEFLNKFERNIYFSQGTIVQIIEFNKILEIFNNFKDIGFILSFKKEYIQNHEFPENVLALEWVPQNDLLGHEKIVGFITHGGLNSLLESIYHGKPIICIGTSIDQINNAVIVEYRNIGIKITNEKDVNAPNLISAIHSLLDNKEFKSNVEKLSVIMKNQQPKESFFQWVNMTLTIGYENLIVRSYADKTFIELNNIDVFCFLTLVILAVIYCVKYLVFYVLFKRKRVIHNDKKDC